MNETIEKKPPVVIFVAGGVVIDVLGVEKHILVDYDNLPCGTCPICSEAIGEDQFCKKCNLDWRYKHTTQEIYAKMGNDG